MGAVTVALPQRRWWMVWQSILFLVLLLAVTGSTITWGQSGKGVARKPPPTTTVVLVATDDASATRRSISVLTADNHFAQVISTTNASILYRGKRLLFGQIGIGCRLTCAGQWMDATHFQFRASRILVDNPVSQASLRARVSAACHQVERPVTRTAALTRPPTVASTIPVPLNSNNYVVESAELTREDDAPLQSGTGNPAYCVHGILRNISGLGYDRLEVQFSILDRDGKKIADQTAGTLNLRVGDRWEFKAGPALYLPYKQGQTVRVDRVAGIRQPSS